MAFDIGNVKAVEIDYIVTICSSCEVKMRYDLEQNITSVQGLIDWMNRGIQPCKCGGLTCDVLAHTVFAPGVASPEMGSVGKEQLN